MGGARLAVERDRIWELARGDIVRGRKGRDVAGVQEVFGDDGGGSVDLRRLGGLREKSSSGRERFDEL